MSAGFGKLAAAIAAVLLAVFAAWQWSRGRTEPPPAAVAEAVRPATDRPVSDKPVAVNPPADSAPSATADTGRNAADSASPPRSSDSAAAALDAGKPRAEDQAAPSFDVVRIEPTGDSVIAGRSAPGATIELLRNGEPFARAVADSTGLFAIVPPPLPPGAHEIVLQSTAPDGTRVRSAQSVTAVIAPKRNEAPLVTVTAPDQPTVVLSRPDAPSAAPAIVAAAPPAAGSSAASPPASTSAATAIPPRSTAEAEPAAAPAARPAVRIATVEAEGEGQLLVSGVGAPGATLRLYLNDAFVAPGATAPDGKLAFSIQRGIRPGDYRVRLDDVDPVSGQVKSRAEVPFTAPAPASAAIPPGPPRPSEPVGRGAQPGGSTVVASAAPAGGLPGTGTPGAGAADLGRVVVPEIATAIVSRGETLWRISKRTYGKGLRYTVIYGANQPQIRNPDLIYPGQVFVLPSDLPSARP